MMMQGDIPAIAQAAVLASSTKSDTSAYINNESIQVKGPNFDERSKILPETKVLNSLMSTGFQATHMAQAAIEIDRMRHWRLSQIPIEEEMDDDFKEMSIRQNTKCTIFLSYTSNMISSGVREVIRFLVQHKMVDCLVTTAGGIEEDFIKCLAPTYVGDFALRGKELRPLGVNRIGNLLVPNENYCKFESWLLPILHKLADEQEDQKIWTPSKLIHRLGLEINDESSVYYWAARNNIPVFCPAITDGSIGDMLYFFSYKRNFILDIVQDVRAINDLAVHAKATGMIILGGGLVKHHVCNANLMRNGADFAVFLNTGQEFDGSDSGARPDEAISWGKIKMHAKPVKVYADASLAFPLLVAMTFAKDFSSTNLSPQNS